MSRRPSEIMEVEVATCTMRLPSTSMQSPAYNSVSPTMSTQAIIHNSYSTSVSPTPSSTGSGCVTPTFTRQCFFPQENSIAPLVATLNCLSPTLTSPVSLVSPVIDVPETDWRIGKSMRERNRYILEHRLDSDVTFVVGGNEKFPGETIRAHSFILKIASSVFEKMLNSDETWRRQPIKIDDANPRAFRIALEYVYCDMADLDIEIISPTLHIAQKYKLHELVNTCENFLTNNICDETACEFLEYSSTYNLQDLSEASLRYIDENGPACMKSEGFSNLSSESLGKVICRDSLAVIEEDVFDAVMHWAYRACRKHGLFATGVNCREVVGDNLYFIRIPLIDPNTYTNKVVETEILSDLEKVDLFRYFYGCPTNRPKVPFPSQARRKAKMEAMEPPHSLRPFPSYPSLLSSAYYENFTQAL
ncbi:hypothetical protein ScPMuIL_007974 [Solemya velum]